MKIKRGIIATVVVSLIIIIIYLFLCLGAYLYPLKYTESIYNYSREYDVDAELVAGVINAESSFNPQVVSKKGAVGLMQLMPTTASWICDKLSIEYEYEMLFNPDYNIRLGTYYLSYLQNKFDSDDEVLCAYNAGEGTVSGWLDNYEKDDQTWIKYPETKDYVNKVHKYTKIYKKKLTVNN